MLLLLNKYFQISCVKNVKGSYMSNWNPPSEKWKHHKILALSVIQFWTKKEQQQKQVTFLKDVKGCVHFLDEQFVYFGGKSQKPQNFIPDPPNKWKQMLLSTLAFASSKLSNTVNPAWGGVGDSVLWTVCCYVLRWYPPLILISKLTSFLENNDLGV